MFRRRSTLAIAVASVGLAATLSACGGSDSDNAGSGGMPGMSSSASPSASMSMPADVSDQDAAFASNMIVHHREAIEMADMASSNSSNPAIVRLAGNIKAAQGPEIETLSGWLTDWGMQPPAEGAGMSHGGMSMPGAMDPAEMEKMGSMKGPEFDEMFLTSMIEHHQGAVTMAQQQVTSGKNAAAKTFAQKVIGDQTAEIAEMRKLLS